MYSEFPPHSAPKQQVYFDVDFGDLMSRLIFRDLDVRASAHVHNQLHKLCDHRTSANAPRGAVSTDQNRAFIHQHALCASSRILLYDAVDPRPRHQLRPRPYLELPADVVDVVSYGQITDEQLVGYL